MEQAPDIRQKAVKDGQEKKLKKDDRFLSSSGNYFSEKW